MPFGPRPRALFSLAALCLACGALATGAFAFGSRDSSRARGAEIEAQGIVRLVGSGPTATLVISGEEREWHVDREEREKLFDLQQRVVRVRGRESFQDLTFASGLPAGRRYTLRDIVVLSVSP
ncbi:MAG: hypothetical protein FWE09_08720 [Treponema sp.]|nr:hypothetical protein [Treponema sp.]